tara:strand:+ start:1442 stop:1999 length:558 start_codon:yes stop_codon:yes gene_type:complete
MTKTLTAAALAEIVKAEFAFAHLLKIGLPAGAIYLTDGGRDIVYDSNTYEAGGDLVNISPIPESADVRLSAVTITLSGVDQSQIANFLDAEVIDQEVDIYIGFIDSSGDLIADPYLACRGRISGYEIAETAEDTRVQLKIANHWAAYDKIAGRRTNTESQRIHFPGDLGFEFASETVLDLKWGDK